MAPSRLEPFFPGRDPLLIPLEMSCGGMELPLGPSHVPSQLLKNVSLCWQEPEQNIIKIQ